MNAMSISKYIRLQELVIDTFNLDAPVEIEKGALLLESTTKTVLLQVRLNILDNVNEISSVSINIDGFTDSGEKVDAFSPFTYIYSDVYLQGSKSFGDRTPVILDDKIRKVTVSLDKVVFRDGGVWRSSAESLFSPPKLRKINTLSKGLLPQYQREIASMSSRDKENLLYIPVQLESYWLCSCGRPNQNDENICRRCGLQKKMVFEFSNEKYLRNQLETFEERNLEQEEKRKLQARKSKRRTILATSIILGIAFLIAFFTLIIQPANKYSEAMSQLKNKAYDSAISIFTSLGKYKDSPEMLQEANYQKANSFLENKKWDDAKDTFLPIINYKNSAELILEADYQKGREFLGQQEIESARNIFVSLGDYKDSKELAKEASYQIALVFLSEKEFDGAISLFLTLGDYNNSADLLLETMYQKATFLFSKEEFEDAMSIFLEIGDYKDSVQKYSEFFYKRGRASYDIGSFSISLNYFQKVPQYRDSKSYIDNLNLLIPIQGTYKSDLPGRVFFVFSGWIWKKCDDSYNDCETYPFPQEFFHDKIVIPGEDPYTTYEFSKDGQILHSNYRGLSGIYSEEFKKTN